MSLRPAMRRWWHTRTGSGRRQASLYKQMVLVEMQFVMHLQTRRQKIDIGFMIVGAGFQRADPDRSIGAWSEHAKERQRWGGRPIPGGERRRMVAKTVWVRVYLRDKLDLGSKEGVKRKPSHFRRDCG